MTKPIAVADVSENTPIHTSFHHELGEPHTLLEQLSDCEKLIADALFGLTTGRPMTAPAVARELCVPLDDVVNVATAVQLLAGTDVAQVAALITGKSPPTASAYLGTAKGSIDA